MVDYSKGEIYKIWDNGYNMCYVGSTTQPFSKRMEVHRSKYKAFVNDKYNWISLFDMFDKYGVEKCKIELVENYTFNTKEELHSREGVHQRECTCVNKSIAGRSIQEWREDNKDNIKQWCEDNKEKIKEANKLYREEKSNELNQWREDNKDKINQWREDNKDKIKKANKLYREEKSNELKQWREDNKDKVKNNNKKYRENNEDKLKNITNHTAKLIGKNSKNTTNYTKSETMKH